MSVPVLDAATAVRPPGVDEMVGVTIATKNRPAYLAALLGSLINQTHRQWSLVVNDQSDEPVTTHPTIVDLLDVIRGADHGVTVCRSTDPRRRYQQCMEAVPGAIEFVLRVDDDVLLQPDFLGEVLRPFRLLGDRRLAAVGGCLPGTGMRPLPWHVVQDEWMPCLDRPTWKLQGHRYSTAEVVEVESLWGAAMCYRRSAAVAAGGWAIDGYSEQIFREDSDMSARWLAAGYQLVVTTAACGWHLVAPGGGSRAVRKGPDGNVIVSHRASFAADDQLFQQRVGTLLARGVSRSAFRRYRLADLERGTVAPAPFLTAAHRLRRRAGRAVYALLRPLRDAVRYVAGGAQ